MSDKPSPRRTDRAGEYLIPLDSLRKPLAGDVPVAEVINPMVQEGTLYEKLDGGKVHCYACAHDCTISDGGRGICQVRYNVDGKLYVPYGYVAALQCDPTEKKPFNHIHPGSDTLTFGMLGCDLHCSYCFTGDTVVITDRGPVRFDALFESIDVVDTRPDGEVAFPDDLRAIAGSGQWRAVDKVFKHHYDGKLAVIQPYYLPELRCTADHRVYATVDVGLAPRPIHAQDLTTDHYLAIPREFSFSRPQVIDVGTELQDVTVTYQVPWQLTQEDLDYISAASEKGLTSREIGEHFGKSGSYIRHVRSKIRKGRATFERSDGLLAEGDTIRFPNEHRPGIPSTIRFDEDFARLMGFYCAEGSIVKDKHRPNSYTVYFTFSHDESSFVAEVKDLLQRCLGIQAQITHRETTLAVAFTKTSAALLFKKLAGKGSRKKHVPNHLFDAPRPVVEAFLRAFVDGDGHRYENGKISITTVSNQLANDITWLVLKLGHFPSLYRQRMSPKGNVQGRHVNRAPYQNTVVWYEQTSIERKLVETDEFYLVPLRSIDLIDYSGPVYNMEVAVEHNYLAGYVLVKNCQNWDISQAMRDANAGRPPSQVSADDLVRMAARNNARCVASSYNEPLITSEWAVDVFKEAQAAGFTTMYISNGNATRRVLEYIRPHTDGYKIDLKTMNDKNYRSLGGVLDHILDGVRMVHEMGFWLEIVTLVIPGWNSSEDELREAAQFIKGLSADIPWHVTAFHKDYKMTDPDNTDARLLIRAAEIGYEEGLRYVYAGNMPGRVGPYEHTFCPKCKAQVVRRFGYVVLSYDLTPDGKCHLCGTAIPGIWPESKKDVRTGTEMDLYTRRPRSVR